jgi:hypothetical protein
MAAAGGWLPAAVRKEIETLVSHGFTYPPLKSMVDRRRRLGLPDLPHPDETEMSILLQVLPPDNNAPDPGERKN